MYAAVLAICLAGSSPAIDGDKCVAMVLGATQTIEECKTRGQEVVDDPETMAIIVTKANAEFGEDSELEYHIGCFKRQEA